MGGGRPAAQPTRAPGSRPGAATASAAVRESLPPVERREAAEGGRDERARVEAADLASRPLHPRWALVARVRTYTSPLDRALLNEAPSQRPHADQAAPVSTPGSPRASRRSEPRSADATAAAEADEERRVRRAPPTRPPRCGTWRRGRRRRPRRSMSHPLVSAPSTATSSRGRRRRAGDAQRAHLGVLVARVQHAARRPGGAPALCFGKRRRPCCGAGVGGGGREAGGARRAARRARRTHMWIDSPVPWRPPPSLRRHEPSRGAAEGTSPRSSAKLGLVDGVVLLDEQQRASSDTSVALYPGPLVAHTVVGAPTVPSSAKRTSICGGERGVSVGASAVRRTRSSSAQIPVPAGLAA